MIRIVKRLDEVREYVVCQTRRETAAKMARILDREYTEEHLNKMISRAKQGVCPEAATIAAMAQAINYPFPKTINFEDEK